LRQEEHDKKNIKYLWGIYQQISGEFWPREKETTGKSKK
jgi:hypothetical protein